MPFELPLVSIVISNFNYEQFIREAISSCFAQDYPRIEVIVVDDVSTDNSVGAAEQALANHKNGRLIKRLVNGGQGSALLDGFRASSGEFVVFLDSDDVLSPKFVGSHVFTHLALPRQVAFTSSHLVHISAAGRLLTGSSGVIRNTFWSTPNDKDVHLNLLNIAPDIDEVLNKFSENINRCIYLPADHAGYHWSSCSGLLFKRAAVEQIAFDEVVRNVRVSADFYFTLSHLFSGSAIIDARLGGYRIHGKNAFSNGVSLDWIDDCRHMPANLFTDILRRFARCVTGPRLDHCAHLLGANRGYPKFLKALEEYALIMNRGPKNGTRIVANAVMDDFKHFCSVLGRDQAILIIRDMLQVKKNELRRRKLI